MERVQQIGCIVCMELFKVYTPALVHHCGNTIGAKRDHYATIPLCFLHHSYNSPEGIHGKLGKNGWEDKYGTEEHYLERVKELLGING